MTRDDQILSAFLDGELTEAEAKRVEASLQSDPALQAELEALMAADAVAKDAFADQLDKPVPLALASAIRNAPEPAATVAANDDSKVSPRHSPWRIAAAAAVAALIIGGAGGYLAGTTLDIGGGGAPQLASADIPGWLTDIADYHAVYANQVRHLVEVPASEADHIQTWLTATVGADVKIPDLSDHGLSFQGARLLVAAGKPVSQLMFTDADDRVVALCMIRTDTPADATVDRVIGDFELVSWGGAEANFVMVGDADRSDLSAIVETATPQV